ncbi:DNA repair protein RadC [Janibacter limosus]|uniref:JAB domain-containing protein n=1 Tax=Janibacter limosus TaxID=53458 RepID=UPI0035D6AFC3|nr:DNA repair protein RadC [Janibacter limosus]
MSLGAGALSDAELVAIHLGTGRKGEGVLTLARSLFTEWGGVGGLARADVDELSRTPGVGPAKACRLVAAFTPADRVSPHEGVTVTASADIAKIAASRIGRARTEQVLLILMDGGNRVRRAVTVASGSATDSLVPVRDVLASALRHDAVAIALAHNHPGGSVEPSADDVSVTERLRRACDEVGLRFLDHVIVAGDRWRSVTASR